MSTARGILNASFLAATALCASLSLIAPLAFLFLLLPHFWHYYRAAMDMIQCIWLRLAVCLTELVFGVKIIITGDVVGREAALFVCNHRNSLDWFYLWGLFSRADALGELKIIIKHSLKHVPGFGWAAQSFQHIFIRRSWADDAALFKAKYQLFRHAYGKEKPLRLLIFPEGTIMNDRGIAASHHWATSHSLPRLQHCLWPRTKGFTETLLHLDGCIEAVYDLTIHYSDNADSLERGANFALGLWPRSVFIHVRRHPIATIPQDTAGAWLMEQWCHKEASLRERSQNPPSSAEGLSHTNAQRGALWASLAAGVVLVAAFGYYFQSHWFRYFVLATGLCWVVVTALVGGIDLLELRAAEKLLRSAIPGSPSLLAPKEQALLRQWDLTPKVQVEQNEKAARGVLVVYGCLLFIACSFNAK